MGKQSYVFGSLIAAALVTSGWTATVEDLYGRWTPYNETVQACEPGADLGVGVTPQQLTISLGGDAFVRRLPKEPTCTGERCDVPTGWPAKAALWHWTFKGKDVARVEGWIRDIDWPKVPDFHFSHTLKRGC